MGFWKWLLEILRDKDTWKFVLWLLSLLGSVLTSILIPVLALKVSFLFWLLMFIPILLFLYATYLLE